MKKLYLFFALLILAAAPVSAAGLTASVDKSELPQGETLTLTLTYDGGQTNEQPQLDVLNRDFNIFSVGSSFQHNYINGKISQKQQWQAVLMPKREGELTIPAVKLGKLTSNPLTVKVVKASPQNLNRDSDTATGRPRYAVDAVIDNKNPYVQQEVNLTVRIYDTGGLQLERIVPLDNDENNWVVKSLGEPEVESKVIDGRSVRVIKIRFALFPQKSGPLPTPEFVAEGFYLSRGASPMQQIFDDTFGTLNINGLGADFADIFAVKNTVALSAAPIDINVRPIPAQNDGGWWIPAESLELYSEWKPAPPQFKVGEAVTRNIYMKAVGVADNQLPNISFKDSGSLKQYPEKPVSEMKNENGKIASYRLISNVYIPGAPGQAVVPEIKVNWFNVKTGRPESTTLPAMTVMVAPNPQAAPAPQAPAAPEATPPVTQSQAAPAENSPAAPQTAASHPGLYIGLASAAFLLGIGISWLLFGRRTNRSETKLSAGDYRNEVIKAARSGQLKELRNNLIGWAKEFYADAKIKNLKDIAAHAQNERFTQVLDNLSSLMYASKSSQWDGEAFISAFDEGSRKRRTAPRAKAPLPDLYK